MHRFHVPPGECRADSFDLPEREAHHALRVLRLGSGETVTVLDGAGAELLCQVEAVGRKTARLTVRERRCHPPPPAAITLLQAIPKGKIIESIIQKATELGAARIVPLLSERVTTRLEPEAALRKGEIWQEVAVEATKQCGAPWLPQVLPPMPPAAFIERNETSEMPLVGSLLPGSQHPRPRFAAFRAARGRNPRTAAVWIGPEGDFTPAEIALIQQSGAHPITLGPLVLRTETAAVYCLSILNYELSEGTSPP